SRRSAVEYSISAPLLHPQQQAYLLLSTISVIGAIDFPLDRLFGAASRSSHRRGVVPVGALGTPLRAYWDMALQMFERNTDRGLNVIVRYLAAMAGAYMNSVDSAMANTRLWFNAAAPIDVGDIDIAAIAMTAANRYGAERVAVQLDRATEPLDGLARVP